MHLYIYIYIYIYIDTHVLQTYVFAVSCTRPVKCRCLPPRVCQCIASTTLLPQVTIVAQGVQCSFVSKVFSAFWLQRLDWKTKRVSVVAAAAAAVTLGSLWWCCPCIAAQMQCNTGVAQHRCNAAQIQRSTDTVQHIYHVH